MVIRPEPQRTAQWFRDANAVYNETQVSKETFGAIHAPTLLVVGEDDANAPLDTVLATYRMLSDGSLSVIRTLNIRFSSRTFLPSGMPWNRSWMLSEPLFGHEACTLTPSCPEGPSAARYTSSFQSFFHPTCVGPQ